MVKVQAADDAAQGALQYFAIGLAADSLVDISGYASGLSTVSLERTGESRTVPGGGLRKASQPTGGINNNVPFECDKNPVTRVILQNLGGRKLYYEWAPYGRGTGKLKIVGNGPCPLQRPSPAGGVARYIGNIQSDEQVRSTY